MSGPSDIVPQPLPGTAPRIAPRIESETSNSQRLDAPQAAMLDLAASDSAAPGLAVAERGFAVWGMPALVLAGCGILALGLAALQTGNFVAAEFHRSLVLGWLTLAVSVAGFGLILLGIGRELRGLLRLRGVDRLRRDLAGSDTTARLRAARHWLGEVEGGATLLPPLAALNDPDAIVPLLRVGVEAGLRARSDALGKRAAMQVVAGMAATPAPALVVLLISWRGLRLIRQVASLYGLRPGVFGTLSLLRRTAFAAGATAVTEVAVNTAAHAVLSTPLLAHLAGEMAGGAVAARRMIVLARATAVACTPLPPA